MNINNLKVHIQLTTAGLQHLRTALEFKEVKTHNNFLVVREGVSTYIIFPNKGFINITGIRGFSILSSVIPTFCQIFGLERDEISSDVVIDNISAAGNFWQRVNLVHLKSRLNKRGENNFFSVHFNRNRFPGAFCKTAGFGTLTVFPSGKYVVVGAKCQEHVEKLVRRMFAVIRTL
jgi:TATA-box binding protein (TBP) (component of TFIID and TFIIIB)